MKLSEKSNLTRLTFGSVRMTFILNSGSFGIEGDLPESAAADDVDGWLSANIFMCGTTIFVSNIRSIRRFGVLRRY